MFISTAYAQSTGGSTEHLVTPREAAARSTVMEAMYAGAQAKTWVQI